MTMTVTDIDNWVKSGVKAVKDHGEVVARSGKDIALALDRVAARVNALTIALTSPDSRRAAVEAAHKPESTPEAKALEQRSEAFREVLRYLSMNDLSSIIKVDSVYINALQNTVFENYVSPFFTRLNEINDRGAKNVTRGDLEHMQRMLALYANPVHAQEFQKAVSGLPSAELVTNFLSASVTNGFAKSVADQLGELS